MFLFLDLAFSQVAEICLAAGAVSAGQFPYSLCAMHNFIKNRFAVHMIKGGVHFRNSPP